MPTHEDKPRWELEGTRPPREARFEAEAERRRHDRPLDFAARRAERDRRRARTKVPPPTMPPAA